MKKLIIVLAIVISPILGLCQDIKYQNVVISTGGVPFPTIRVCTEPATGTPCTPLAANIYSDPGGSQPLTNPFTGDANGNFTFYANPSLTYHVQITALGILPYDIPYITLPGNGGGSSFYQTILANGTAQTQRPAVNFIAGTGITFNCVDNAGLTRTDCTITSTGGGSGNVTTTPGVGVNQDIVQQNGTRFSANNFATERIVVPSYNWAVQPGITYTGGVQQTFTFSGNCPLGVIGADTSLSIYISGGTGTAEVVPVTGGTCTGGLANGTIIFTPANTHSGAFTIGSATTGTYEALRDATPSNLNNAKLQLMVSNPPGTGYVYSYYAPMVINGGDIEIDGQGGAMIDAENTRTVYLVNGSRVHIHGMRIGSKAAFGAASTSAAITQTACASNVSTITTTLNPPVGSYVDIQQTFATHYWGPHVVATTSPSSWTYTDTNCGGLGTIGAQATAGGNAYQFAFVETGGQSTQVDHIDVNQPTGFNANPFNNMLVVLNDQSFHASDLSLGSGIGGCTANYCAQAIYAPGPFGLNASVLWLDHLGFSLFCTGNGITNWAGNTMHISNAVIQGTNEFSMWGGIFRGGFGGTLLTNVYNEVGGCTNPLYPGSGQAQQANAGLIQSGSQVKISGGEGPIGQLPVFASLGNQGTEYNYYLVVHDSVLGVSVPLYCGLANVDSVTPTGSITVACPRVSGTNTITYDLIRTTGAGAARVYPTTALCTGGSTTACGSVLLAQAQCSTTICSFTDNAATNTTSYTVPAATYYPGFGFWPAGVVLATSGDTTNVVNATTLLLSESSGFLTNLSPILTIQNQAQTAVFEFCPNGSQGVFATCLSGTSVGNNNPTVGGLLLQNGPVTGGAGSSVKGRLNFLQPPGSSGINPAQIITYFDSNATKTIADGWHRPLGDANDLYVGIDILNTVQSVGLAYGASFAHSWYIGSLPDNASYLMRLTSSAFNVKVNTTITGNLTVTGTINGGGAVDQVSVGTGAGAASFFTLQQGAVAYNKNSPGPQGFYQAGCVDLSNGCSGSTLFVLQNGATLNNPTFTNPSTNNLTIAGAGSPSQLDFTYSGTGCSATLSGHSYLCVPSSGLFQMAMNGGNPFTPGPSSAILTAECGGTVGTTNNATYIFFPMQQSSTTCAAVTLNSNNQEIPFPAAGTLKNLYCVVGTAGIAGDAITLYKNNTAQALTIPIGTALSGNDTTHTVSVAAGDAYSIRWVVAASGTETAAGVRCQLEYVRTP